MNGPVLLAFAVLLGVAIGESWFAVVRWRKIQERRAAEWEALAKSWESVAVESQRLRVASSARSLSRREED